MSSAHDTFANEAVYSETLHPVSLKSKDKRDITDTKIKENQTYKTSQKKSTSLENTISLEKRVMQTRNISIQLATPLSDEDQVVQSMDDASPTKWHLAHTTWFFEFFILSQFLDGYQRFNDDYEYCFNSYYEAVGPRHPRPMRGLLTTPTAADVREYRACIDEALTQLFAQYKGDIPEKLKDLLELGVNHEQQHQELLLTDILSLFAVNPLHPSYIKNNLANDSSQHEDEYNQRKDVSELAWHSFDGGLVEIGYQGTDFFYDNEGPVHEQYIAPFRLANRLVTNAEWLAFMEEDGYKRAEFWLADGWALIQEQGWQAPLYWQHQNDQWLQMSLYGLKPIQLHDPVTHLSYYEANAFANWAEKRLPTEFEWEYVARNTEKTNANTLDKSIYKAKSPVIKTKTMSQMFGDLWEWTQSAYSPYPGYKTAPGPVGEYNGKFMCNQYVLRGGSCVTPKDHIRPSYRNFFFPHQRWQFTGLRLAMDI